MLEYIKSIDYRTLSYGTVSSIAGMAIWAFSIKLLNKIIKRK
jgi:hypothetical protein